MAKIARTRLHSGGKRIPSALIIKGLYQEIILQHGQSPRNFYKMEKANYKAESFNPFCGDFIRVYLKITKGIIKALSFEGQGCLISMASASLMTQALEKEKLREAERKFKFFRALARDGKLPRNKKGFGNLAVFSGIYRFPQRIKCVLLPWHVLISAILKKRFAAREKISLKLNKIIKI